MQNHFHFLVRIKKESEIGYLVPLFETNATNKWETVSAVELQKSGKLQNTMRKPTPSRQFSHLFNSYTKWFNKKYRRTGSLFEV
jgi:hypothetical protein